MSACEARGDAWAEVVRARVLHVNDLPAADAIYHHTCSTHFRTKKQMSRQFFSDQPESKKRKIGRPQDQKTNDAFLKVVRYLQENDDEQMTVSDLVEKMRGYLGESASSAYSNRYMKAKIEEYFGENIIITNINGKPNVVTFRRTAASILEEFHLHQKDHADPEQEKLDIIKTAAKLIRSDIKLVETSNENYPLIETEVQKHVDFLPLTLKLFLEGILVGKNIAIKLASIGQAIVQSARPRVILVPLQVGLAVQLHHSFASRFLIDTLHRLGFCSSYQEVLLYNQNAAVDQGTEIPDYGGEFVQYVADNVDHNLRTLDGNNTFHGMGMIATTTPGTRRLCSVRRRMVSLHVAQEITTAGKVEIH